MTHTYSTFDGGTVEASARGYTIDLHVRDAAGRTVATVEMNTEEAYSLMCDLEEAHPLLGEVR